jgi:hypothetical protein
MEDARRYDAHQNLVISRAFLFKRFDPQGTTLLPQDGRLNFVHLHFGTVSQCPVSFCSDALFFR